jgi:protocatechuate 3,4-dioxygenase beta subunit
MSRKELFQQLHIASPCSVEWESMIGNDRVRFCEHCRLSVHHVDALSRKQLRRLIARSHGRVCVNYWRPNRSSETAFPMLHQIGRRTSALAAGAFSATLSLSTATAATQVNFRRPALTNSVAAASVLNKEFSALGTGTLRGRIVDPQGALVPGASVSLTNTEFNELRSATTNDTGEFLFEGLQPGAYTLRVEAPGFATKQVTDIQVKADDDARADQVLAIAPLTVEIEVSASASSTGGAMAMVMPSEPLVKAAMEDDLDALNAALTAKPDANIRDKDTQTTALEYAVRNGNREIVQVLLSAKADVNAKDADGQTVLMMLSDKVTTEIVWDLINAGAKVNEHDKDGDTPLLSAAEVNNVEALKALLDAGAKIDAHNNDGETALMKAAASGLVNNVHALIMAGADVNARDKEKKTALIYANENNERAVARLFKAHGAIEFVMEEKQ